MPTAEPATNRAKITAIHHFLILFSPPVTYGNSREAIALKILQAGKCSNPL
jgi:hypothetical protein